MPTPLRGLLIAALLSGSAAGLHSQQTGADKPVLLFLGGNPVERPPGNPDPYSLRPLVPDEQLQGRLQQGGYGWFADCFSTKLTPEFLRQFNAVVLLDVPTAEANPALTAGIRRGLDLLRQYVAEGGGLPLTGCTEYGMWALGRDIEEMNRFLEPLAGKVLLEQVGEKEAGLRIGKPTQQSPSDLAWTGNVVQQALTAGGGGLAYPTSTAWCYYAHPVQVGADWQVLVKGSASAYSYTLPLGTSQLGTDTKTERPGTYTSAPPLLAARESGKGRLVL